MGRSRHASRLRWSTLLLLGAISCSDDKDKKHDEPVKTDGGMVGPQGMLAISVTADFQGAFGLLTVENSEKAALALQRRHNETAAALGLKAAPRFDLSSHLEKAPERDGGMHLIDFTIPSPSTKFLTLEDVATSSPLKKIGDDGVITDALTQEAPANAAGSPPPMPLPDIQTIAVSPTKEIYLQFKQPFVYKDVPAGEDGWKMENGYQCQIFVVKGGTLEDLKKTAPEAGNLECIDNEHFINNWQTGRNAVFQFDAEGNVYYPGSIPNSPKTVVYKRTRDGSKTTEVINANICVQDFLITESGGVFYTGQTCSDQGGGGGGDGGGFFRYVTPEQDGLIEIARDWWNFKFDTSVEDTAGGKKTDTAVFFGPDPTQAETASWNSACLFHFDPSKDDPSSRIASVITCGADIYRWMGLQRPVDVTAYGEGWDNYTGNDQSRAPSTAWKSEYKRRCESKGQIFAGGGSQINSIQQDSGGEIYVIGNIRKKVGGNLTCDVEMRGPHCVLDGNPAFSVFDGTLDVALDTEAACSSKLGTWVDKGNCSNGASTSTACLGHSRTYISGTCSGETNAGDFNGWRDACIPTWQTETVMYRNVSGAICVAAETGDRDIFYDWNSASNRFSKEPLASETLGSELAPVFLVNRFSCTPSEASASSGGDQWTKELRSLALVDKNSRNLVLKSHAGEQAIKMWIVNDRPYYSSFDTSSGKYMLNTIKSGTFCQDSRYSAQASCEGASLTWSARMCLKTSLTTKAACENAGLEWLTSRPEVIIENFEAYNLAESGDDNQLYADGLDFSSNQYKFGTIDLTTKSLSLKEGITGTIKTIVILPKD